MQAIEQLAISKSVKDAALKRARAQCGQGTHEVDISVRVHGKIEILPDEEYIPTVSIPLKATLALFIRHCGVTRDVAIEKLKTAMTEALEREQKGVETAATVLQPLAEEDIILDCMGKVTALTTALPKQTRKGKCLTNLSIDPL